MMVRQAALLAPLAAWGGLREAVLMWPVDESAGLEAKGQDIIE
jgi:hypothetical protein